VSRSEAIRGLWAAIDERRWHDVHALLHADFAARLPQSGERFNAAQYVRVNREYPGDWRVRVSSVIEGGDWVVTEVEVSFPDHVDRGVSLFRFEGDKVIELREYWPEPFDVPEWRAKWAAS
jgi:hypothetical protein